MGRVLASFVDDVWEPESAAALLHDMAKGGGTHFCLRVAGSDLRMVAADARFDEMPSTASYLWVLWSGPPPTLEEMIALWREVA